MWFAEWGSGDAGGSGVDCAALFLWRVRRGLLLHIVCIGLRRDGGPVTPAVVDCAYAGAAWAGGIGSVALLQTIAECHACTDARSIFFSRAAAATIIFKEPVAQLDRASAF